MFFDVVLFGSTALSPPAITVSVARYLRRIVPRDKYLVWGTLKSNQYFYMSADGFHNSWLPFCEESKKLSFLLACLKTLTNSENPSSNHLQEAGFDFPVAVCDSKSCSESRLRFRKLFQKPAVTCTVLVHCRELTNWPMEAKESWNRTSGAAFRIIYRINNCF